ncbi:MAG: LysM peptidoglycan-binding domain-containing protein [Bacteroidetes bacterium]|nr:LysM peptidoglycan-binding domain-containing protein [Bacteroidota bacterium]
MDIIQIIKLFKRNLLLLILVPIIFAGVTYYFTRNQEKVYQSEAVIYTGITTGYSIESATQRQSDYFTMSAQYDNMINLLRSRQTLIETSLLLLTQDLSLERYNPQYISMDNFNRLQASMPKRVKDMVVKNNKSGIEREKQEQINNLEKELRSLEKEINKKKNRVVQEKIRDGLGVNSTDQINTGIKKEAIPVDDDEAGFTYHVVQQGESLSLIASRYGVSRGQIMSLNDLSDSNLNPGQSLIIKKETVSNSKYHTVKPGETLYSIAKKYGVNISKLRELNSIDNKSLTPGQEILISESTRGRNLINSYDYAIKSVSPQESDDPAVVESNYITTSSTYYNGNDDDSQLFVKDPIIPPGINPSDFKQTLNNLTYYYNSSDSNYIYGLLHYGGSKHYSEQSIGRISIYRISNSDLVRLTFTSDDPGICQQTLKIVCKVFMQNYKLLRANQTNLVVKYFEAQVDSADKKLQAAEDRLLKFNMKNNIINYYEQSKAIASQKEDLDLYYQNEQIRLASSVASLKELELNLTARDSIYLKSDEITQMKKELSQVTESIVINELASDYDERVVEQLNILRTRQLQLRNEIKFYVDQLYLYSHSAQGLPIKELLSEWLKHTINGEESKASLIVLARRKIDFVRTYQKFAPLGAMLTRIEREIKVAEQSYLELLKSLNLAKTKQQNEEMATNIKLVDEPFFPISAKPSGARYIVLGAAIFGFLLIGFIILLLEYFDRSMKNPSQVVKSTNMKLAGAFPRLSSRSQANELAFISQRLIDIIIQNIKLKLSKEVVKKETRPYFIAVYSTQNSVGKTLLCERIINRLREIGDNVLYLNHSSDDDAEEDFNYSCTYKITDNFMDIKDLQQLISSKYLRIQNKPYDFIFLELPSIVYNTYPIKLISTVDISLYVISATSNLSKADKTALDTYNDVVLNKPMVVINAVELYNLDEILSDMPGIIKYTTIGKIKQLLVYPFKYRIHINRKA